MAELASRVETQRLRAALDAGMVPIVAGFQGVDAAGDITTIGRGGSDTTAVALAVALKADECQILTDVDGVYTTDPRVVADARRLDRLSFEEMLELAGARFTGSTPEICGIRRQVQRAPARAIEFWHRAGHAHL